MYIYIYIYICSFGPHGTLTWERKLTSRRKPAKSFFIPAPGLLQTWTPRRDVTDCLHEHSIQIQ